jgi:hypothetical protein
MVLPPSISSTTFSETDAIDLAIASSSTSEVINDCFQISCYYSTWNDIF